MKQTTAVHYKSMLVEYLQELRQSAGKTTIEMKNDEKLFSDPIDRAAAELDRDVELLIRNRDITLIREIRAAISRIDQGVFGICEDCGEPISVKRLRVKPMSRLCIHCQSREERGQKVAIRTLAFA